MIIRELTPFPHPRTQIYESARVIDREFINGYPVRDVDLRKTRRNSAVQVDGHINRRKVHWRSRIDGMTTSPSSRKSKRTANGRKRKKSDKFIQVRRQ